MNDISNPYEVSAFVRYLLGGLVILFGFFVAIKSMEKEREEILRKLSKKHDKHLPWYFKIRIGILRLPYWGRVAVLVIVMALYCFMLVYFKMDETSMRRERKALYEQIKNAVQEKMVKEKNT